MTDASVSPGVEVPVVRLRVFALLQEGLLDDLEVRLPLAPADDLADTIAGDDVEAQDEVRVLRIPRLVERLGDARIVRHDDGLRLTLRQRALLEGPQVLAPLQLDPLRLEDLEGLVVGD